MKTFLRLLACICLSVQLGQAQCGPGVPVFTVNLVGNPGGTWISPNVSRNDFCCGTTAPNVCVEFVVLLDSNAVGINFNIASGAVPGGALFYQVNCSPPQAVGQAICLNGPGPHILTFCKPGNNSNTYQITSVPAPIAGKDITINQGCVGVLSVAGFSASTVSWTSVFPGAPGVYNSYLSCVSGCTTTTVTGNISSPAYVDYKVCGVPSAPCFQAGNVCDTVRVYFHPTLVANILPSNPTVCFGQTTASLTVAGSGGTPAYSYTWSNGAHTQTITAGAGPYTVLLGDASGCPPVSANVTVTSFSVPITANAGPDKVLCSQLPATTLSGTVTGATGGLWSGGQGTYSPSNSTLSNMTYVPTGSEIASGMVNLVLSTTGNGSCPGSADTVKIRYQNFLGAIAVTNTNVSCSGGSNGMASASVAGGTSPYSYLWNTAPAYTTAAVGSLLPGSYTVTVTDNIGCRSSASVTITQPASLNLSPAIHPASCFGASNGSVAVTASGGTPSYTYSWSPVAGNTPSLSNLPAGTYTVLLTDANGCNLRQAYTVAQPLALSLTYTASAVSCFNGSNGSILASASGGTGPYAYNWQPTGGNAPLASGLTAGTYTLQVLDANSCAASVTVAVTQPILLQVSTTSTNKTCNYLNNGTAQANASGGTPGYTYTWQPGNLSGASVSGLSSGVYTLTAGDAKGCFINAAITITQPPVLALSVTGLAPVSCFGGSNGNISVSASGGTPVYSYSWQPITSSSNAVSGLGAGTYTAHATDANGCIASLAVAVTQPLAPLNPSASSASVTCYGGTNGSVSSSASGGTAPYTYSWSPLGISAQNVANIGIGNYSVTITDAMGCIATATTIVAQPSAIVLSMSEVNSTCGNANGQASVSASGGSSPYLYQWSPAGGSLPTASGLPAGAYNVVVTDNKGCAVSGFVLVNDNAGPNATIISKTDVSCYGGSNGSATVGTSGGTGPFTYNWQPSGGSTPTANGLSAGIYTVTVIDANGCQSLATTSPAILQPPPLLVAFTTTNVSCNGGTNGVAIAGATGGSPGYGYSWSPLSSSSNTLGSAPAGSYTVTVTDLNSCITAQPVTITEPPLLSVGISSSGNVSCFGGSNGSASAAAAGGTMPYHYIWTSGSSAPSATGLSAGSYTVTATDAKGCTATAVVALSQPSQALTVAATSTAVSCFGGNNGLAMAVPSGGTPGYTYSWSPAGSTSPGITSAALTQMVMVTDNNGCTAYAFTTVSQPSAVTATIVSTNATCGNANGSAAALVSGGSAPYIYSWSPSGTSASSIAGLGPGGYSVSITDSRGCSSTYTGTLINIPGPVLNYTGSGGVSCFGGANGTATVNPSGGTAPFQYAWQPYGSTVSVATGLSAGNYTCTVFDSNNCTSSVTLSVTQPPPLAVSVSGQSTPSCYGGQNGSLTASASGGTPAYTYTWSPGGSHNATATGLASMLYTVAVSDARGCQAIATASLSQPPQLQASVASFTNPGCYNGSTGAISAGASGGTAPYQFSWQTTPVQTSNTATGLPQGTYSVIITDNSSCTVTATAALVQPAQVITAPGQGDTVCTGQAAILTASAGGGSGSYFYSWSPSVPGITGTQTVTPSANTNYTVTAYDQNGCQGTSAIIHVEVYNLAAGNVTAYANSPICPGNGTLVYAILTGNPGPVTYSWNNNLGNTAGGYWVVPVQPTDYIVTVSNSCGTIIRDTAHVAFSPPPVIVMGADTVSGCVPLTVQFNNASVSGNVNDPISSWSWAFGDGSGSSSPNPAHTYTNSGVYGVVLTVTTGHGCTNSNVSAPLNITVHPKPVAAFYVNATELDVPFDHLLCTNQSIGAVSYQWTFGDGGSSTLVNPTYLYNSIGSFSVDLIAINQFGCRDTAEIRVSTNSNIIVPTAFTPNENGPSGGSYNSASLDNDIFFPYTSGVTEFHMSLFNRWGELIFESTDLKTGWDGYYRGKLCQQGVYVWKIDVKWNNGKTFNKVGDVTLLR